MMRAKLLVTAVKTTQYPGETIEMMPVTGKGPFGPNGESEDNTYARYTPSGKVELTITNPALLGRIKLGMKFYADFTEAAE